MPGDTCDQACSGLHTCELPSTSEKLPVPTSLSTMQSHMPNWNFVIATATLLTVGVVPGIFRRGADSSNEGAKIWFSGYYKYQKSPKKNHFSPSDGVASMLRRGDYSPPSPPLASPLTDCHLLLIMLLYPALSYMRHLTCFNIKKLCISDTQILERTCNAN